MSKSLVLFSCLVDAMGIRFSTMADKYIDLLFDNVHTSYAEVYPKLIESEFAYSL